MKKMLSVIISILIAVSSFNLTLAGSSNNENVDITELTPSEYLNYIKRVKISEPKDAFNEPVGDEDILRNNTIYIVMKQEFSDVDFCLTTEYFPELDIKNIESLMSPTDTNSDLINKNSYRNIYKITLNTNDLKSLDNAVEILKERNDVKSVSLWLESQDEQIVYETADAISNNQETAYYEHISSYFNSNNIYQAWNYSQGSREVKIGIIDSGIDYTHPDLTDNVWVNEDEIPNDGIDNDGNGYIDDIHGWNFRNDNNNVLDAVDGHGTVVASTAGAVGKNNLGVSGTAPEVRLVILKSFADDGVPQVYNFYEAIPNIITYAINEDIYILNGSFASGYSSVFKAALENYGGLYFASAGNSGTNNDTVPHYPTSFGLDNVITVTATDFSTNSYSGWANYGPTTVDIAAPGDGVMTCRSDPNNHSGLNDYGTVGGTSISAPYAAGVAALLMSYAPNATPMEIKEAIINSAIYDVTLNGKVITNGKINAFGAMQYLYNEMEDYKKTWDFSDDDELNNMGIIQSKNFLDGITINPSTTNRVEVMFSHKEIDGRYFSNYLALKEPGNTENISIKISVMGPTDIYNRNDKPF